MINFIYLVSMLYRLDVDLVKHVYIKVNGDVDRFVYILDVILDKRLNKNIVEERER